MKTLLYLIFFSLTTGLLAQSRYDFDLVTYTYTDELDVEKTGMLIKYKNESGDFTGEEEEYYGMSAEAWISYKGYTSIRLLTLFDIERKLEAAGKTAPKLTSVRRWIDAVLMQFALNPAPKLEWDECPYTFEETLQEAISILNI